MFCLEAIKSTEVAFNPIGCDCQYKSHGACLQVWFEQKNQYECPICHAVSVPNPTQPVMRIVYIQREEEETSTLSDRQQKCIAYFCLSFLLWSIFISVLDYILAKS